jgi:hypothetical protein
VGILRTGELIDTDRREGNCLYIQAGRGYATEAVWYYHTYPCRYQIVCCYDSFMIGGVAPRGLSPALQLQ